MPYSKPSDLPDNVKKHLPKHAQEIYMEAFNSAYDQYEGEEVPHKVAWNAVKKKYEKSSSGVWIKKSQA